MSDHEQGRNQGLPSHLRELSYEIHTNRELEFMLKGIKPLAWFSDMIFDDHDMWEPDKEFERQVGLGKFVKHEERELWEPYTSNGRRIKGRWTRFYALKDEAWRIHAFILLKKLMDKHPWSDALERMEGSLLGYTDEQNDEWLEKRRLQHIGWQCITLYAATTNDVLSEIAELGNRAFPRGCLPHLRMFIAKRIPSRSALELAGLFPADSDCKIIRFGVEQRFFRDSFELNPAEGITPTAIRKDVSVKELNEALHTVIQILKFS